MPRTLTCAPGLLEKDLSGRTYVVTGANSGSGIGWPLRSPHPLAHDDAVTARLHEVSAKLVGLPATGAPA